MEVQGSIVFPFGNDYVNDCMNSEGCCFTLNHIFSSIKPLKMISHQKIILSVGKSFPGHLTTPASAVPAAAAKMLFFSLDELYVDFSGEDWSTSEP